MATASEDLMRRVNPAVTVSVRRGGFKLRTVARLKFEAGPDVAGWVNYRGKVYPVFTDPKGNLYLNEDGWASTRAYPLTHERDDTRNPAPRFRF
jgi:hypothetical protein